MTDTMMRTTSTMTSVGAWNIKNKSNTTAQRDNCEAVAMGLALYICQCELALLVELNTPANELVKVCVFHAGGSGVLVRR